MAAGPAPLVSVIVPAFNAEATLAESLRSALASDYHSIEVLVVDDGSTDATSRTAEEIAGTDRRVRVLRRPRRGLSAALNAGLVAARGAYVAGLDSDDLWHPSKLEKQVQMALRQPELAFIYCWARYLDDRGRIVRDASPQEFPRHALCRGLYESLVGGGSSALMKRSAIVEAGGWDESLAGWMDLDLQLKISQRHAVGFVPQYLVGYRIRPGSLSSDPATMLPAWRAARERFGRRFADVPHYVHRWAHGRRCAMFAEAFAWRRNYAECASLLGEAMRHDPAWTRRFLAYRIGRHLKRRLSPAGQEKPGPRPQFLDCSPGEPMRLDGRDLDRESNSVRRLEMKRVRLLAALDEGLAGTGRSD